MKKLLLTLGLAVCFGSGALADGTINPLNNVITRLSIDTSADGVGDRFATAADGLQLHIFYGPAGTTRKSDLIHFPQFAVIGNTAGVFTGLLTYLPIPGTEAGETISLQFRICSDAGLFAETPIGQFVLGPEIGPGTVTWQPASGVDRNRFKPLTGPIVGGGDVCVPEPSTLALGGLACAFLLLRARKTFVRR